MGRPTTKADLLEAAETNYRKLNELTDSMAERELLVPFHFQKDEKRKEAHWQRDKNLRDVLIHLYEWHKLLLEWAEANKQGENRPFLPEPYNWKNYGDMNMEFWRKQRGCLHSHIRR